jgi:rubredoxin
MREIIIVALLSAIVLILWYRFRNTIVPILREAFVGKTHLCPKCGGQLDMDEYTYKHTLLWTCRICEHTYETLRQKR